MLLANIVWRIRVYARLGRGRMPVVGSWLAEDGGAVGILASRRKLGVERHRVASLGVVGAGAGDGVLPRSHGI